MKNNQTTQYKKIPLDVSVHVRYLYQDLKVTVSTLKKKYPQYSRTSLLRHARKKSGELKEDGRKLNKGRPNKLTPNDEKVIIQKVKELAEDGPFYSRHVQNASGVNAEKVSNRTIRRVLNSHGYGYFQCRRKGQLTKEDLPIRMEFAKKCKTLAPDFWEKGISFYLDGVSWSFKTDPSKQARTKRTRMWRKKGDGLKRQYTAKGKKEGTGGKSANYYVAIAHGKGVVFCKRYEGHVNGKMFADLIRNNFSDIFARANNQRGKLFLQDGDPSQNSKVAREAMDEVPCRLFKIPARSPDLNPIENIFHLINLELCKKALKRNIGKETFKQFCKRIESTIMNFPVDIINRTISSMNRRIDAVIDAEGDRTKY